MKYQYIREHSSEYPLTVLCRVLEVSKSGYFEWLHRSPSQRSINNQQLLQQIVTTYQNSRKTYGYRRIHSELRAQGVRCSLNRVSYLMRQQGIHPKTVKKFKVTTESNHSLPIQDNILNRQFHPNAMNQRWCGDITYVPTQEGWLYLATVLDLYSRRVIGWAMGNRNTAELVCNALNMALKQRSVASLHDLLWHSDRGVQYTAVQYQQLLATYGIQGSMSRKSNCWDNGAPRISHQGGTKMVN